MCLFRRFLGVLILAGFQIAGAPAPKQRNAKLHVLTSFLPVYCFAVNVTGDLALVENLIPGTVEPHDYQLSPNDFRKLNSADLLMVNGLGLENWLGKAFRALDHPPSVIELSSGMDRDLIQGPGGIPNPHIWLDPALAQRCVSNVLVALQNADPAHAGDFARNAARYQERLKILENEMDQALIPVRSHAFATYHNAFPYFIRRFGLNLAGIVEETPEVAPPPRYLAGLLRKMRHEGARALFAERQSSDRLVLQIASDLKIRFGELDTIETGTLNPAAYEEEMRVNLKVLMAGLR